MKRIGLQTPYVKSKNQFRDLQENSIYHLRVCLRETVPDIYSWLRVEEIPENYKNSIKSLSTDKKITISLKKLNVSISDVAYILLRGLFGLELKDLDVKKQIQVKAKFQKKNNRRKLAKRLNDILNIVDELNEAEFYYRWETIHDEDKFGRVLRGITSIQNDIKDILSLLKNQKKESITVKKGRKGNSPINGTVISLRDYLCFKSKDFNRAKNAALICRILSHFNIVVPRNNLSRRIMAKRDIAEILRNNKKCLERMVLEMNRLADGKTKFKYIIDPSNPNDIMVSIKGVQMPNIHRCVG